MKELEDIENILELLKERPYSVEGLKAFSKLSEEEVHTIVTYLRTHDFIDVSGNEVKITDAGLEFLNSPVQETTPSLYNEKTKKTSVKEREEMAERFGIEIDDVEHATWMFAKDLVGVKLRRDLEEKKKKEEEK